MTAAAAISEDITPAGGNTLKQHVWGLRYIDELVQVGVNTDPAGLLGSGGDQLIDQVYYALTDANYNVVGLVDATGKLAERYEYTPYGERKVFTSAGDKDPGCYAPLHDSKRVTIASAPVAWGINDIGHQGLMHDAEISLIYNRARILHPGLGRFVQRDPLGYVDGMSMVLYLRGAPTAVVDPTGMASRSDAENGGLEYSCNCGWLDTSHAMEGMATSLRSAMITSNVEVDSGASGLRYRLVKASIYLGLGITYTGEYEVLTTLSNQQIKSAALGIFRSASEAAELRQGIDPRGWIFDSYNSSFSEEDLPSNMLSFLQTFDDVKWQDVQRFCWFVGRSKSLKIWDEGHQPRNAKNAWHGTHWEPAIRRDSPTARQCCKGHPQTWPDRFQRIRAARLPSLWVKYAPPPDPVFYYP